MALEVPKVRHEVERGKDLADIITKSSCFVKKLKSIEQSKRAKEIQLFTYATGLCTEENPLTLLSLDTCAYVLENEHGINMGYGKDEHTENLVKSI